MNGSRSNGTERKTHHEACADDLSDACTYLLGEFTAVDPPGKVIEFATREAAIRAQEMKRASGRRGTTLQLEPNPLIWLPEAA